MENVTTIPQFISPTSGNVLRPIRVECEDYESVNVDNRDLTKIGNPREITIPEFAESVRALRGADLAPAGSPSKLRVNKYLPAGRESAPIVWPWPQRSPVVRS